MKVYVDSDNYEIYYNSLNGRECLEPLYAPLIVENIHDYTKQVRKEVLGELCNMLGDRAELIDFGNGCAEFMFTTYDLQECSKVILDQIQGESGHKQ